MKKYEVSTHPSKEIVAKSKKSKRRKFQRIGQQLQSKLSNFVAKSAVFVTIVNTMNNWASPVCLWKRNIEANHQTKSCPEFSNKIILETFNWHIGHELGGIIKSPEWK